MSTIILGSQWGDEGKGKLTDILCSQAQICARAAGGHNAGQYVANHSKLCHCIHVVPLTQ